MRPLRAPVLPLLLLLALPLTACRGLGFFLAGAAVATAVIVSTTPPPPPPVVYVPAARPGYVWQPGYWTREDDGWVWVDGQWIALQPGWTWSPTHWAQAPDGTWQLVPGRWIQTVGP
jgi:hypothetical protein